MARTPRREQDQVRREILQGLREYAVRKAEDKQREERERHCGTVDLSFPLLAQTPFSDLLAAAVTEHSPEPSADDFPVHFLH